MLSKKRTLSCSVSSSIYKHVFRVSEEVVEAKGVVTDSGAANSAHCLFGYVRNVSLPVVNLLRQHLDQNIESFVVGTEIQGVSGGTLENPNLPF